MGLIEGVLPSLINGVSQQSPRIRLSSQAEAQDNCIADPVNGLRPRPGSKVHKIYPSDFDLMVLPDAAYHVIDRGDNQHLLVLQNGHIKIVDLATGTVVHAESPTDTYFTNSSGLPDRDIYRFLTVADTTFVVNRSKSVAVVEDTTAPSKYKNMKRRALFAVKRGDYSTKYTVKFGTVYGTVGGWYETPKPQTTTTAGVTEQNRDATDTNLIAQELSIAIRDAFNTAVGLPAVEGTTSEGYKTYAWTGYLMTQGANWIAVETDVTEFSFVTATDTLGDTAITKSWGGTPKISDLPASAPNNWKALISSDDDEAEDDYYVSYDGSVWTEDTNRPTKYVNPSHNMPRTILANPNGTFTVGNASWVGRKAGDENTNPDPSFKGKTITDILFFKDRLGFLCEENIILSEVGEYFNFYRTTVLQTLDSDRIDVTINSEQTSLLTGYSVFDEKLYLFSKGTQFILKGQPTLTPTTVEVDVSTRFEMDTKVVPRGLGRTLYYAQPFGGSGKVREYYVDSDTGTTDSADITAHCPRYIEGKIKNIASSESLKMLAVTTVEDDYLYIYNFMWQGQEKVQSAWHRWYFTGFKVYHCWFDKNKLYLFLFSPSLGKVSLEYIDLSETEERTPQGVDTIILDHLQRRSAYLSYDLLSWGDGTVFVMDSTLEVKTAFVNVGDSGFSGTGTYGYLIPCSYTFSEFQLPAPARGRDLSAVRLPMILKTLTFDYTDSHSFKVEIKYKGRDLITRDIKALKVNSGLPLAGISRRDGKDTILIQGKPENVEITIKNNSIYPFQLQSVEFEADVEQRARRL